MAGARRARAAAAAGVRCAPVDGANVGFRRGVNGRCGTRVRATSEGSGAARPAPLAVRVLPPVRGSLPPARREGEGGRLLRGSEAGAGPCLASRRGPGGRASSGGGEGGGGQDAPALQRGRALPAAGVCPSPRGQLGGRYKITNKGRISFSSRCVSGLGLGVIVETGGWMV